MSRAGTRVLNGRLAGVAVWLAAMVVTHGVGGAALAAAPPPVSPPLLYADLVDLSDSAPLVLLAEVREVAVLEAARARGVKQGWVRVYVEARPVGVLRGKLDIVPGVPVPGLRYLADVPLDERGKLPPLKKQKVIVFARASAQATGDIQLVAADGQLFWNPELEQRVGNVLAELAAPDAARPVTGVNEALFEQGTLAGAGETQIFLTTKDGAPASISVLHRPGQPTRWSASFSEVVNDGGKPPRPETLQWYRLACALPEDLPPAVNVSETQAGREQAVADYRLVRAGLGQCARNRK